MKRLSFIIGLLAVGCSSMLAQGAYNIKINEVVTSNSSSIQDEFGAHDAWVELVNSAYSSYNVRGMYLTTNRAVLNPDLSAPERIKLMSIIPNGDTRTALSAKQHIVFFFGSNPAEGALHINQPLDSVHHWVALYDGNGVDLIDSVTVPTLKSNCSYARIKDGNAKWVLKAPEAVTPDAENFIQVTETKVDKLKREDPHGFGITVLSMGIVFACLALLWLFFSLIGWFFKNKKGIAEKQPVKPVVETAKKVDEVRHATSNVLKEGLDLKGRDKEIYIAVIAMALKQYQDNVHDVESGIITIKPHKSAWAHRGEGTEIPVIKK